ncbi:ABC transporter, ATP-binding subunit [Proteus vulgaris]|nr:ABC transporter, ATP-binding subunit [Proteus vulgaris]
MIEGLKIQDFSAGYARHLIIKSLDIDPLPKGKVTVLLGPNGSGKINIIKSVSGIK